MPCLNSEANFVYIFDYYNFLESSSICFLYLSISSSLLFLAWALDLMAYFCEALGIFYSTDLKPTLLLSI